MATRDATMVLITYRHGLRASELCALRWEPARIASVYVPTLWAQAAMGCGELAAPKKRRVSCERTGLGACRRLSDSFRPRAWLHRASDRAALKYFKTSASRACSAIRTSGQSYF
jgi:integrase